jgi:hypothetical protein
MALVGILLLGCGIAVYAGIDSGGTTGHIPYYASPDRLVNSNLSVNSSGVYSDTSITINNCVYFTNSTYAICLEELT